jgi:myo-inositol-1-phosphate synthase
LLNHYDKKTSFFPLKDPSMNSSTDSAKSVLLLVAGIKGAIGSTLAVAAGAITDHPHWVMPYLTTTDRLPCLGESPDFQIAGWDCRSLSFEAALAQHGVLRKEMWAPLATDLQKITVHAAPDLDAPLKIQVDRVKEDIQALKTAFPDSLPVLINLLPAGQCHDLERFDDPAALYEGSGPVPIPDFAYVLAAIESGVPVVNFTPNIVEVPAVIRAAFERGVPMAGRDGKTGQTYFKMVLASAFKARSLYVNGWYSLNILGNADGENLMAPEKAACKLTHKTGVLDSVLGYAPGEKSHGKSAHKVHIDYYPPRGDAKEAWDVVDFEGLFGMDMSLRLDLQGRDSILAAPMVLDLARWMAVIRMTDRSGPIPELDFYFKKGIVDDGPVTFEDQLAALSELERLCQGRPTG